MKKLILSFLGGAALVACSPVETPVTPELSPEQSKTKTIGPVVTIHCTLKSVRTGRVTTGTYFTYDTRTIDMPSAKMIKQDNMGDTQLEIFREYIAPNKLQNALIELPLKQRRNKFKIDIEDTWFRYRQSMQFMRPDPIWGSKLGSAQFVKGTIVFGNKVPNVDGKKRMLYEGAIHFGTNSWVYYGMGDVEVKDREHGSIICRPG